MMYSLLLMLFLTVVNIYAMEWDEPESEAYYDQEELHREFTADFDDDEQTNATEAAPAEDQVSEESAPDQQVAQDEQQETAQAAETQEQPTPPQEDAVAASQQEQAVPEPTADAAQPVATETQTTQESPAKAEEPEDAQKPDVAPVESESTEVEDKIAAPQSNEQKPETAETEQGQTAETKEAAQEGEAKKPAPEGTESDKTAPTEPSAAESAVSTGSIPSAPEEQPEQIPDQEQESVEEPAVEEIQGIDTYGLEEPRGNWLFKRIWWERAETRYDKIRQTVHEINEVYIKFFAQRTELDKKIFDPFYLDIGFKQGELQARLSDLIARIEKERQEGDFAEDQRELLAAAKEDREMLETSHRNAHHMLLLNQAADEIIDRVVQQRSRIAQYEKDAWGYMREIARILSDKQARELYYKMDAAWRNIKSIQKYLEQDLQRYLKYKFCLFLEHITSNL